MEDKKNKTERTRNIPVQPEPEKTPPEQKHTFSLHIEAAKAPHEVMAGAAKKRQDKPENKDISRARQPAPRKTGIAIWNTLEWIATSALIFMVIFFAVNYQAYYQLLVFKLDRLRGIVNINPYIEQIMPSTMEVTQQLLPITASPDLNKKQIPPINLKIAPPDERVIIPRINQNVPVVGISSENLIRRDWSALEKDIQEALQDGVVHYPGTAQPGQSGNVVITGHSSYFAWDPGRFKDVFALLHEVKVGDKIIVYFNQKEYFYEVYDTKVVMPDQVDVLTQSGENRLTLITCTPVGTNLKRLVVLAKPV